MKIKDSNYLSRNQLLNDVGTWLIRTSEQIWVVPVQNPATWRQDFCSGLMIGLLPLDLPSLSSMYTLPSGFFLKYHLLGVQKCFSDYTYYVEVKTSSRPLSIWFQLNVSANFPDSPTGQTGIIIVLGIYFAPFQPLGWGHFISSLVLPITPSWSFRDSGLPHILTKAPVQNHPPLNFQRIHDRAQILLLIMCWFFLWLLQFLFILPNMPHWLQKLFTAEVLQLGIHNWDWSFSILSIISTFWWK